MLPSNSRSHGKQIWKTIMQDNTYSIYKHLPYILVNQMIRFCTKEELIDKTHDEQELVSIPREAKPFNS